MFFALWPGDATRAQIETVASRLKKDYASRGRWINPRRYHLTVRYLGAHASLPPDLVALACAAGDRVRGPAFEFLLNVGGCFPNEKIPWWLGCDALPDGLNALWHEVSDALRALGLPGVRNADPVPHVTILRDADRPLQPVPVAPIVWDVDEFVLIDSLLGPQSAYTVLRRWKLAGPG